MRCATGSMTYHCKPCVTSSNDPNVYRLRRTPSDTQSSLANMALTFGASHQPRATSAPRPNGDDKCHYYSRGCDTQVVRDPRRRDDLGHAIQAGFKQAPHKAHWRRQKTGHPVVFLCAVLVGLFDVYVRSSRVRRESGLNDAGFSYTTPPQKTLRGSRQFNARTGTYT